MTFGTLQGPGWSATKVAWVGAPGSLLIVTMSLVTGVVARRVDSRRLLVVGAVLTAVGLALIGEFHRSVPQVMFLSLISALGLAICLAVGPILMIESVSTEEQTLAGGTQNLLQGVAAAVTTQVVFVLLSQHEQVVQGTARYSDTSYGNALWMVAALALAGALLTPLIPKAVRIADADAGAAVKDEQTV